MLGVADELLDSNVVYRQKVIVNDQRVVHIS